MSDTHTQSAPTFLSRMLKHLYTLLSDFVEDACKDRDASHGAPHMKAVCDSSLTIFRQLYEPDHPCYYLYITFVMVCAWLHDVPDHKYDLDGTLGQRCRTFLAKDLGYDQPLVDQMMQIIELISFSKEEKAIKSGNPIDYDALLGNLSFIRHIISDADKDQAMGDIGIIRCAQYTLEKNPGIDRSRLMAEITIHFEEKLGRLYTDFIRTEPGKVLAKPNHDRMVEIVADLDSFLDTHPEIFETHA